MRLKGAHGYCMGQVEVGQILDGKITRLTSFGAFVELSEGCVGMVHISEVASTYVKEISDFCKENQEVKVKVLSISPEGKISLSMKQAQPKEAPQRRPRSTPKLFNGGFDDHAKNEPQSFEDMMAKFKSQSDEKISDLRRGTEAKHGGFSRRGGRNH